MPHTIYLHSRLVLSRKVNRKSYKKTQDANNYNALESALSLFLSYVINVSVIGTFAYYSTDKSIGDIDLYNADKVLNRTFGSAARYI